MIGLVMLLALAMPQGDETPPRTAAAVQPTAAARLGSSPDAILALHRYGQCLADRAGWTAGRVLRQDFTTKAYHTGLGTLLNDNRRCVPSGQRAQFSSVLGAGAIAEALLKKNDRAMLRALPTQAIAAADQGFSPSDTAAICVVKRDTAGVEMLLTTMPVSTEERAAITALAPSLSQCLPAGQDLHFNRPGLRAIIALSAYRIAAGASPAKQG